jgi:oxygen-independent coproporphyrinogen-3 oxidase
MLAVRMRDGLPIAELTDAGRASVPQLASWGLVDQAGITADRVVLTQRGRLMADAVVRELLP